MVAAKWAGLKHGGDRKSDEIKSPIGDLKKTSETKTRDEAAALLNVGTSSIDRAKQIIKHGTPELQSMAVLKLFPTKGRGVSGPLPARARGNLSKPDIRTGREPCFR